MQHLELRAGGHHVGLALLAQAEDLAVVGPGRRREGAAFGVEALLVRERARLARRSGPGCPCRRARRARPRTRPASGCTSPPARPTRRRMSFDVSSFGSEMSPEAPGADRVQRARLARRRRTAGPRRRTGWARARSTCREAATAPCPPGRSSPRSPGRWSRSRSAACSPRRTASPSPTAAAGRPSPAARRSVRQSWLARLRLSNAATNCCFSLSLTITSRSPCSAGEPPVPKSR